jgi:hypothetical protein
MKIIKLALFVAILTAVTFAAAHAEDWVDPSGTFALQIADGWSAQETQDVLSLAGPGGISQMNIAKVASDGLTLDVFAKAFPIQMKKELKKFKLISSGRTKIGGAPAAVWVYTAKVDGIMLKFKNYVIFPEGTDAFYNVVFASTTGKFQKDVKSFDGMVKSWSWSES